MGVFLWSISSGPIGMIEPFTSLTDGRGLTPSQAATWTFMDAHGVHPSVVWTNEYGGSSRITEDVLFVVSGVGNRYAVLRGVPLVVLTCGGVVATVLSNRFGADGSVPLPVFGAAIALGYTPVVTLMTWLATVPATSRMDDTLEIGQETITASGLAGAMAGPPLVWSLVSVASLSIWFGAFGGVIATACSRLPLPDRLRL